MTPHPLFAAFLGVWEIVFILVSFVVMLLVIATIRAVIYFLSRRHQTPPPHPPVMPTPPTPANTAQAPLINCPHCGKPVTPTALGGICPECMLKAGLATQTEGPSAAGPHGTKVVHPPPSPAEIASLFPQLEILECLGRGGMGVVYQARQPRLNRLVALKILAREKEQDAQFTERFTREAQALARLNHPNIVTVYDFGYVSSRQGNEADGPQSVTAPPPHVGGYENTPQGHYYLVMEFVDGLNLRQLLQTGKMPPEQALTIVPKICEALQYAHEQGIVHRDIKPENILLDKNGRVKIADFGIAKMLGDGAGQQTLTGAKDAVGTPHYMAPEQIEKPLTVDHRADIYSLGVVFYEMLTGELPLGKFQPPSSKVQIDVRLDEVVLHALEKEPERRYQQVSEIKTRVETIAHTPSVVVGEKILRSPFTVLNATPFSKFIFWAAIPIFGCYFFLLLNDHFNGTNQKLWHYYGYVFFTFAAICGVDTVIRLRRGLRARTAKSSQELKFMYLTMLFSGMLAVAIIFVFVFLPGWQKHHAPPPDTTFYIGRAWFPQGDSIEITAVQRTENQMTVKGHYRLVSHNNALLALYITTATNIAVAVEPDVRIQISQGRGDFELIDPHPVPGLPHVSMYGADGHCFASLYFGNKAEASEESKAGWITSAWSASALQFRLVLPDHSTGPADVLPSASGSNRFHLSRQVLLDDTAIARAGVDFTQGRRMIVVRFTDAGAKQFEAITATNIGHQLAIVFRGQVLSAPVIQSVIPGGECQVDCSVNASEVNEIVDYLNRTTTASDQTWKFAAPCGRILPFRPRPEFLVGWLDLDSGTVMTNSRIRWETRAGHEWIQNNSLDVAATESDQPFPVLLGIDMIIAPAPTNGWNNVTAADVVNDWTLLQDEPRQMQMFGAMPGQSDTFFFQTREGGKGILQILGFADNPHGVKVRYKLLQVTAPGEDFDPTTGLPTARHNTRVDPNTGLPLPPAVTSPAIDPTTGLPATPVETGTIDPATGLPVAAPNTTDNEIDPTTGLPIRPNRTEIDPTTGLPRFSPTASSSTGAGTAPLSYQWYFQDTNPPTAGNRMSFGPVIKRFVETSSRPPYDEYSYLDLDTGRLLSLGPTKPAVDPFNVEQFYDWRQKSGADVTAQIVNDSDFPQNYPAKLKSVFRGLVGLNTVLLPVDKSAWDNMSPQAVVAAVAPVKVDTTRWTTATTLTNGLPATHLFRTSEGGMGLLQITGFTRNPPGVQIRYKLVQLREAKAHLAELRVDDAGQNPRMQEAPARIRVLEQGDAAAVDTSRLLAEQPPVVVETQPVSGARDVEPGIAEIRVRFSKPMTDGSWSWSTAWQNSTPESVGPPHYLADQCTCVMKVRLEPDRTYAWWLNSNKFKNFTDQAGRPAVPYLLIFQTRQN